MLARAEPKGHLAHRIQQAKEPSLVEYSFCKARTQACGISPRIPGDRQEDVNAHQFLIAALGASAGGLEALETSSCRCLPTGVAFVAVQHLSPDPLSSQTEREGLRCMLALWARYLDQSLAPTPKCRLPKRGMPA
jgi:chemotaxis response regulator CheB